MDDCFRLHIVSIEGEALNFRRELRELKAARSEALRRREDFNQEMDKLNFQRARLSKLMGRKSHLRRRTIFETDRANKRALSLSSEQNHCKTLLAV